MLPTINAIFIDIGGTLYHCPTLDKEYSEQLLQLIVTSRGIDASTAREILRQARERHPTKIGAMAELGYTRKDVHDAFCKVDAKKYLKPSPAVRSMLEQLHKCCGLGVISNFRRSHVEQLLKALEINSETFDWFVTEDVVEHIKPSTDPFEHALALCGFKASQCLYVGDDFEKDILPAKKVGMVTVLIKNQPNQEIFPQADEVIASIVDLPGLLNSETK